MRLTLTALALASALPAAAQELEYRDSETGEEIGLIHWTNKPMVGPRTKYLTFNTPAGEVVLRHWSSPNGVDGCCPDTVEVWQTPPGVMVFPSSGEVEEGDTAVLRVVWWSGM